MNNEKEIEQFLKYHNIWKGVYVTDQSQHGVNHSLIGLLSNYADQQTALLQSRIKELEDALAQLNKPTDCGMYESDTTNCNCKHCGVHISNHK